MAGATGLEPVQPSFRKLLMACDYWQNAQEINRLWPVQQSAV